MLCRVFHKGKEEHITKLRLANEFETTVGASFPNLVSSPLVYQTPPGGSQQIDSFSEILYHQDHSFLNLAMLGTNYPQEASSKPFIEINSRSADEYEFLLDMGFEDNNYEDLQV